LAQSLEGNDRRRHFHSRDDAILKPLMSWLEEQNKGRQIGWE